MFTAENTNVVPLATPFGHGRVRGSLIQLHLDWLRDYGSRTDIIGMFESLDAPLRHQVLAAQPSHWYRFVTLADLQMALANRFADGDVRFIEQIGAYAAQSQLIPLRDLLHPARLHDFYRSTASAHRDSLDFGSSEYEAFGDDSGRMIVTQLVYAAPHRAFLAGFYRESIAQHGGRDATVREVAAGIFNLSWR